MENEFFATANTNEKGLVVGRRYLVAKISYGVVEVYGQGDETLTTHRTDNFDDYEPFDLIYARQ